MRAKTTNPTIHPTNARQVWFGAWAGLAALVLGIGIGRFGYPPLIPLLVERHWFTAAQAAYLASANLAGYLIGAMLASQTGSRLPVGRMARLSMSAVVLSYLLCIFPIGFLWFLSWRLIAGVAGGFLMVLAVPAILARTPAEKKGRVGGVIFTGIGAGIVIAGSAVPFLARKSVLAAWMGLGLAALAIAAVAWPYWKHCPATDAATVPLVKATGVRRNRSIGLSMALLMAMYCLAAVGLAPYSLFWVDFIARGLGAGLAAGGRYWSLFGISAMLGPVLTGFVADRIGFRRSLRWCMFIEAAGAMSPLFSTAVWSLALSTICVGAMGPGFTSLASGRTLEIAPPGHQKQAWGWMTAAFSISYAATAWILSFLFSRTGSYRLLFGIGAAAVLTGAILDIFTATPAHDAAAIEFVEPVYASGSEGR